LQALKAIYNITKNASPSPCFRDEKSIEELVRGPVFEALRNSRSETFISPNALKPAWSSAYMTLLLWHVLKYPPVSLSAEMKVGNVRLPLAYVIDKLDIFLDRGDRNQDTVTHHQAAEEDEEDKKQKEEEVTNELDEGKPEKEEELAIVKTERAVRFNFAEFVVRHFTAEMSTSIEDTNSQLPFIRPLLQNPELLDYGAPLEYLLRVVIGFRLRQISFLVPEGEQATWGRCFPGIFDTSMIASESIVVAAGALPVSYLPRIVSDKKLTPRSRSEIEAMATSMESIWGKAVCHNTTKSLDS